MHRSILFVKSKMNAANSLLLTDSGGITDSKNNQQVGFSERQTLVKFVKTCKEEKVVIFRSGYQVSCLGKDVLLWTSGTRKKETKMM